VVEWGVRLIMILGASALVVAKLRGPRPEPLPDLPPRATADGWARQRIRDLEEAVDLLTTTVEDLQRRVEDLEYRADEYAEPPPDL
jgi:hypothetical protein